MCGRCEGDSAVLCGVAYEVTEETVVLRERSFTGNTGRTVGLKCDVRKYFYRIDHDVLKSQFRRLIKDTDVL